MNAGGLRRVVLVGLAYGVVAAFVLSVAGWIRPILALPADFPRLLRVMVTVGFPIALLIAWHYPNIGHHGAPPEGEGQE